mgnify:CR=1 FL=1
MTPIRRRKSAFLNASMKAATRCSINPGICWIMSACMKESNHIGVIGEVRLLLREEILKSTPDSISTQMSMSVKDSSAGLEIKGIQSAITSRYAVL